MPHPELSQFMKKTAVLAVCFITAVQMAVLGSVCSTHQLRGGFCIKSYKNWYFCRNNLPYLLFNNNVDLFHFSFSHEAFDKFFKDFICKVF